MYQFWTTCKEVFSNVILWNSMSHVFPKWNLWLQSFQPWHTKYLSSVSLFLVLFLLDFFLWSSPCCQGKQGKQWGSYSMDFSGLLLFSLMKDGQPKRPCLSIITHEMKTTLWRCTRILLKLWYRTLIFAFPRFCACMCLSS